MADDNKAAPGETAEAAAARKHPPLTPELLQQVADATSPRARAEHGINDPGFPSAQRAALEQFHQLATYLLAPDKR